MNENQKYLVSLMGKWVRGKTVNPTWIMPIDSIILDKEEISTGGSRWTIDEFLERFDVFDPRDNKVVRMSPPFRAGGAGLSERKEEGREEALSMKKEVEKKRDKKLKISEEKAADFLMELINSGDLMRHVEQEWKDGAVESYSYVPYRKLKSIQKELGWALDGLKKIADDPVDQHCRVCGGGKALLFQSQARYMEVQMGLIIEELKWKLKKSE